MKLERDGFLLIEYGDTSNTIDVWHVNNQIFGLRQDAIREADGDDIKANSLFYAVLRALWVSLGFSSEASDFTLNRFADAVAKEADALQKKTLSASSKPDVLPGTESASSTDHQQSEQV